VEQQIAHFSSQDAPISVGIVFDTSGSMGPKLSWSRQAVMQFLRTANPEDEFFLVEFNDSPSLSVALTSNGDEIQNRLIFTQTKGSTALFDAVYLAIGAWTSNELGLEGENLPGFVNAISFLMDKTRGLPQPLYGTRGQERGAGVRLAVLCDWHPRAARRARPDTGRGQWAGVARRARRADGRKGFCRCKSR